MGPAPGFVYYRLRGRGPAIARGRAAPRAGAIPRATIDRFASPFRYMHIARWLHLLGVVVWVGGMFFAHLALRPAAGALPPPQRLTLLAATLTRFVAWVALAILAILGSGGWLLHAEGGFGAAGPGVQAMTLLGLVMTAIYAYLVARPLPRLRAAVAAADWPAGGAAMATARRLVAVNLLLGLATITVAALVRA